MGVRINNEPIEGLIVVGRVAQPPELPSVITRRWGLLGETEVRSLPAGRMITIPILLNDDYPTLQALEVAKRRLAYMVGTHGALELYNASNVLVTTYLACTFLGFQEQQGEEFGPVNDVVGFIGGWWEQGLLQFRQLALDDLPLL